MLPLYRNCVCVGKWWKRPVATYTFQITLSKQLITKISVSLYTIIFHGGYMLFDALSSCYVLLEQYKVSNFCSIRQIFTRDAYRSYLGCFRQVTRMYIIQLSSWLLSQAVVILCHITTCTVQCISSKGQDTTKCENLYHFFGSLFTFTFVLVQDKDLLEYSSELPLCVSRKIFCTL